MTSPLSRLVATIVLVFAVAVVPRVARADDPATRASRRYFERGEKLFALGKFDEALDEYQKAFDAKPIPDFLFNIGQCYRNLNNYDQAIFSFQKYLKLDPDAPNRESVQQLIDELEQKKQKADANKFVVTPPPVVKVETSPPIYKRWWFWTGIGVVAAGATFGIIEGSKSSPPATDLGNVPFK